MQSERLCRLNRLDGPIWRRRPTLDSSGRLAAFTLSAFPSPSKSPIFRSSSFSRPFSHPASSTRRSPSASVLTRFPRLPLLSGRRRSRGCCHALKGRNGRGKREITKEQKESFCRAIAVSEDGKVLALGNRRGHVCILFLAENRYRLLFHPGLGPVCSLALLCSERLSSRLPTGAITSVLKPSISNPNSSLLPSSGNPPQKNCECRRNAACRRSSSAASVPQSPTCSASLVASQPLSCSSFPPSFPRIYEKKNAGRSASSSSQCGSPRCLSSGEFSCRSVCSHPVSEASHSFVSTGKDTSCELYKHPSLPSCRQSPSCPERSRGCVENKHSCPASPCIRKNPSPSASARLRGRSEQRDLQACFLSVKEKENLTGPRSGLPAVCPVTQTSSWNWPCLSSHHKILTQRRRGHAEATLTPFEETKYRADLAESHFCFPSEASKAFALNGSRPIPPPRHRAVSCRRGASCPFGTRGGSSEAVGNRQDAQLDKNEKSGSKPVLAVASGRSVQVFDLRTMRRLFVDARRHRMPVSRVASLQRRRTFASLSPDLLLVWNYSRLEEIQVALSLHATAPSFFSQICPFAFSPTRESFVLLQREGCITVWASDVNTSAGSNLSVLPVSSPASSSLRSSCVAWTQPEWERNAGSAVVSKHTDTCAKSEMRRAEQTVFRPVARWTVPPLEALRESPLNGRGHALKPFAPERVFFTGVVVAHRRLVATGLCLRTHKGVIYAFPLASSSLSDSSQSTTSAPQEASRLSFPSPLPLGIRTLLSASLVQGRGARLLLPDPIPPFRSGSSPECRSSPACSGTSVAASPISLSIPTESVAGETIGASFSPDRKKAERGRVGGTGIETRKDVHGKVGEATVPGPRFWGSDRGSCEMTKGRLSTRGKTPDALRVAETSSPILQTKSLVLTDEKEEEESRGRTDRDTRQRRERRGLGLILEEGAFVVVDLASLRECLRLEEPGRAIVQVETDHRNKFLFFLLSDGCTMMFDFFESLRIAERQKQARSLRGGCLSLLYPVLPSCPASLTLPACLQALVGADAPRAKSMRLKPRLFTPKDVAALLTHSHMASACTRGGVPASFVSPYPSPEAGVRRTCVRTGWESRSAALVDGTNSHSKLAKTHDAGPSCVCRACCPDWESTRSSVKRWQLRTGGPYADSRNRDEKGEPAHDTPGAASRDTPLTEAEELSDLDDLTWVHGNTRFAALPSKQPHRNFRRLVPSPSYPVHSLSGNDHTSRNDAGRSWSGETHSVGCRALDECRSATALAKQGKCEMTSEKRRASVRSATSVRQGSERASEEFYHRAQGLAHGLPPPPPPPCVSCLLFPSGTLPGRTHDISFGFSSPSCSPVSSLASDFPSPEALSARELRNPVPPSAGSSSVADSLSLFYEDEGVGRRDGSSPGEDADATTAVPMVFSSPGCSPPWSPAVGQAGNSAPIGT